MVALFILVTMFSLVPYHAMGVEVAAGEQNEMRTCNHLDCTDIIRLCNSNSNVAF